LTSSWTKRKRQDITPFGPYYKAHFRRNL